VIVTYFIEQLQRRYRNSEFEGGPQPPCIYTGPFVSFHMDVIEQSMDEDRHWSVKELAYETAICGSRVLRTLTQELKLHRIAANGVPHYLRCDSGRATRRVKLERFHHEGGTC